MTGESPLATAIPRQAVFLSYASQDTVAASRICDALRAAGIEVWFDKSELRGGEAWDQTINRQIRTCALFLPVISAHTDERSEGYFRREWRLAVERMRDIADDREFLLPVVVDGTHESTARVPERFREFQWLRLPEGVTPRAAIERVQLLLSGSGSQRSASRFSPVAASDGTRRGGRLIATSRLRWVLAVLAALILAGVAYRSADRHTGPEREPPASAPASRNSIAVLPFVDMSEAHDQEYFANGMAEEIIGLLAQIPGLKVIGRTSSFQFKGRDEDLRQIGATLGVAYLVEGSVRRVGERVRVTAQLIDARDGTHRWSETYDREGRDALSVQDEVTAALVRALQLEVIGGASGRKPRALPGSAEAYDAYLRGLHALNRFDEPGLNEAAVDFKRALELDPQFTPAAEQLARVLCDLPTWGFVPPSAGFEDARVAAESALRLDPHSAVAHTILAAVHAWYDWDWAAARRETTLAMAGTSPDAYTFFIASMGRMAAGEWKDAMRLTNAGITIDPLHASAYEMTSWVSLRSGDYRTAEAAARRALQITPTYSGGHRDLGNALLMHGKLEEALVEMQRETFSGWQQVGIVLANRALHRDSEANAAQARLEAEHAGDMALGIAETYAFDGRRDQAFSWLDRAYAQKDIFLWAIKGNPFLRNLEDEPRFKLFLRRMNLPN
jgi:TolB-like protein/Tfp pilus assembly protein PilF